MSFSARAATSLRGTGFTTITYQYDRLCVTFKLTGSHDENLLRRGESVEGSRKAGVDRHLHDDLDYLFLGAADVKRAMDMDLELRQSRAHGGECGHGGDLSGLQVQPRPAVDVAERKLDNIG